MSESEGRARHDPATTTTFQPDAPMVAPGTHGERARRKLRLHHTLVRRPRWSDELDQLLDDGEDDGEPGWDGTGDYWGSVTCMNLGLPERRRLGWRMR